MTKSFQLAGLRVPRAHLRRGNRARAWPAPHVEETELMFGRPRQCGSQGKALAWRATQRIPHPTTHCTDSSPDLRLRKQPPRNPTSQMEKPPNSGVLSTRKSLLDKWGITRSKLTTALVPPYKS